MSNRVISPLVLLFFLTVSASAQDKRFDEEANAVTVLLSLATLCAEDPTLAQWAYAERVARRAWGSTWKEKYAAMLPNIQRNFNAENLAKQADTCERVKGALSQLK